MCVCVQAAADEGPIQAGSARPVCLAGYYLECCKRHTAGAGCCLVCPAACAKQPIVLTESSECRVTAAPLRAHVSMGRRHLFIVASRCFGFSAIFGFSLSSNNEFCCFEVTSLVLGDANKLHK